MFGRCCSVRGGRFSAVPSEPEDDDRSFRRGTHWNLRCRPPLRRRRGLAALLLLGASSLSALAAVHRWNQNFVLREVDAPLDHWASTVQKPWYALTCPKFSAEVDAPTGTDIHPDLTTLEPIPIWMISARPFAQVAPVLASWTEQGFDVELVNTTEWSRGHAKAEAAASCQRPSFGARLFTVYRRALSEHFLNASAVRSSSPGPRPPAWPTHAVLLEDDAKLVDGTALRRELAWAVSHHVDYYSFYAVAPKRSCVYDHGTVAQVVSRRFAERLVHRVDRTSLCRLPIDLWIAKHGPWYVTRQKLVEHVGTRLVLP